MRRSTNGIDEGKSNWTNFLKKLIGFFGHIHSFIVVILSSEVDIMIRIKEKVYFLLIFFGFKEEFKEFEMQC